MIFKKIALIAPIMIILFTILGLFPYCTHAEITDWKTYSNLTHGIKVDYPSTWLVNESITAENIVTFHNPRTEEKLNYLGNSIIPIYSNYSALGIFIQNLPSKYGLKNITLEDYTAIKLDNILSRPTISNITEFKNFSLGGYPAYKVEYTTDWSMVDSDSEDRVRSGNFTDLESLPRSENYTETWTIKNDTVYSITSIIDNTDAKMKKDKDNVIQKIIDSFDFLSIEAK